MGELIVKLTTCFATFILFTQASFAEILKLDNLGRNLSGVKISNTAELTTHNENTKLNLLGAGLRTKKILVSNINIYVAQLFSDNSGKFVRTEEGALNSINEMNTVAITLTMLRDVESEKMMTAFTDSFDANKIDIENPGVKAFLKAVNDGGEVSNGKTLIIALKRNADGSTIVNYESTKGKLFEIKGDKDLFQAIASIWLGQTADQGLKSAKDSIVRGE